MSIETFGDRLQQVLTEKNITRKALAANANISVQAVGNYINGSRKPDCEVVASISKALNVSSDYLLGLSEVRTRNENIQGIHEKTGLLEGAISALIVDKLIGDLSVSSFLSFLIKDGRDGRLVNLVRSIENINSLENGTICSIDIEGEDYDVQIKEVFRLVANTLFWDIVKDYKCKTREIDTSLIVRKQKNRPDAANTGTKKG